MSRLKINKLSEELHALDHQVEDSNDALPKGSRCMAFIGSKGSGKTSLFLSLLTNKSSPYRKKFQNIILVSPSAPSDNKMKDLYEECEEEDHYYDHLSEKVAVDIKEKLMAINDANKAKGASKKECLIILDDVSGQLPTGKKPSEITSLFTNSRHLGNASVWIISHKFTSIPTIIRNQLDCLFIWKTNSKSEVESFKKNLNIDEKLFEKILKVATSEPYSFLYLNMTGGKTRMFKRFDEFLE